MEGLENSIVITFFRFLTHTHIECPAVKVYLFVTFVPLLVSAREALNYIHRSHLSDK